MDTQQFNIQGITASQLAQTYSTPLYVYDEDKIRLQCQTLNAALHHNFGDLAHCLYACKANNNINILKIVKDCNIYGIDAVSPQEVELALMAGFPPQRIVYTANYITDDEIQYSIDKDIILNVGEVQSLQRLIKHKAKTMIRLNLDIGIGDHAYVNTGGSESKFGIHYGLWKQEILNAQQAGVQIIGLHQHIGSKMMKQDEDQYILAIQTLFAVVVELNLPTLQYIDIGGGFGVKYKTYEQVSDLMQLFGRVRQLYDQYFTTNKPILFIEPGRYIIAEAGYLLTKVSTESVNNDRTFLGVDTGMNHLIRPALYQSYHPISNSIQRDQSKIVTVCGNMCESGDVLGKDRDLAALPGDILVIGNVGAYGYSMASNYNMRGKPAEVLIRKGESVLLRRRETLEDMLATTVQV